MGRLDSNLVIHRRTNPLLEADLLNYEGTEVLLIGTSEDPKDELRIELHPKRRSSGLRICSRISEWQGRSTPTEPLFAGELKVSAFWSISCGSSLLENRPAVFAAGRKYRREAATCCASP